MPISSRRIPPEPQPTSRACRNAHPYRSKADPAGAQTAPEPMPHGQFVPLKVREQAHHSASAFLEHLNDAGPPQAVTVALAPASIAFYDSEDFRVSYVHVRPASRMLGSTAPHSAA